MAERLPVEMVARSSCSALCGVCLAADDRAVTTSPSERASHMTTRDPPLSRGVRNSYRMPESSSGASAQFDDVALRVDGAAGTCNCVMVVRIAGHQLQLPNAAGRREIADLQAVVAEVVRIAQLQRDRALLGQVRHEGLHTIVELLGWICGACQHRRRSKACRNRGDRKCMRNNLQGPY